MKTTKNWMLTVRCWMVAGLALLLVLGMSVSAANAQVGSATITGTVQDPTGAVIPGATIVLKDVANQTTRSETSNKTGFFSFVNLAASTYQATVSAAGFNTVSRKNIELHIGDQLNLPALTLMVQGNAATVTVTSQNEVAPTLVCDPRSHLAKGQYFNPSCFRAPVEGTSSTSPAIGDYNLPYIHGPRFENDEIGLFKTFQIKGSRHLEIRAQGFNFLNHPLYSFIQYDPDLYLEYDAYGGLPTTANSPGTAETKLGARVIQFASKFYF